MFTKIINNYKKNNSILKVNNIKKSYNGRETVKDISLYVENSEIVGLLGPNGAGKTTSFYMILGIIPVNSGSIEVDKKQITDLPIHKRSLLGISYLPQDASIFRGLTVEDNIKAILEIQKKNGKKLSRMEINEYTDKLLYELQISNIRYNMAISLSGGERRRVEIARALATEPRFMLLDEPFAGVDPISILEIQKIIMFLKSRNIGVLITDHNVRETLGICDRAYIINEGSVISSGTPDEIIADKLVRQVYLGDKFNM